MSTKFIFDRRHKLNAKGEGMIELEIYLEMANRKFRSTGIKILPIFWNEKNQRITNKHPNAEFLNKILLVKKKTIDDILLLQSIDGVPANINLIDNNLNNDFLTFYKFFQRVIDISNQDISPGTNRIYIRTLRYLKLYSKDVNIGELTLDFFEKFNIWMITKKNLNQNSRATMFKKIKKVMNEAFRHELITYSKNPFTKGFIVREIEVPANSLTLNELKIIEGLDMELRPELDKTRDMFLFSCYTSMRYGDMATLTAKNVDILNNGEIRLSYRPNKTIKTSGKKIEWITTDFWNGKIDLILRKYLAISENLFFEYSNAFYNRQLKELQSFADIKTTLHAHLGRHTCITLLINDFGLDITKAQLIAGHSKIEQTRKYLRVTEIDLSNAAKKLNWNK
ncbi:MAG: site-specific integrase [Crocinitomicaceae bacterium]